MPNKNFKIPYAHSQRATLLFWIFGTLIVTFVAVAIVMGGSKPWAPTILISVSGFLAATAFLFHSLHVSVTETLVSLSFGPGLIRKRFTASEIVAARPVRNRWFYGWGVRYTPHGWLFNVSGWEAVEIELKSGRKYRIGTDEPDKLTLAIEAAITP